MSEKVTIGIDLGGTGTRIVALAANGQVVAEDITPTPQAGSPRRVIQDLAKRVRVIADAARITAVGIGASGPVDGEGLIRNHDTLAAYSDVPIAQWLAAELGAPCLLDNDAVTAALGEHAYGAGRGSDNLLVVTLGTGVGVAVLRDGQPFRTAGGLHPEGGHLAVPGPAAPCYCGLPTCWEQLASRSALAKMLSPSIEEAAAEARSGESASVRAFEQYGAYVAVGLSTLITLCRPDRVVLTGGTVPYFELFHPALLDALSRPGWFGSTPPIVAASLGPHSGAIGAAVLARRTRRRWGQQRTRLPARTLGRRPARS